MFNVCRCSMYRGYIPIFIKMMRNGKVFNVQMFSMYRSVPSTELSNVNRNVQCTIVSTVQMFSMYKVVQCTD